MKEPAVQVPVHVFLALVRIYKEQPQELCDKQVFFAAAQLEKRAYRKYLEYKAALKTQKGPK